MMQKYQQFHLCAAAGWEQQAELFMNAENLKWTSFGLWDIVYCWQCNMIVDNEFELLIIVKY